MGTLDVTSEISKTFDPQRHSESREYCVSLLRHRPYFFLKIASYFIKDPNLYPSDIFFNFIPAINPQLHPLFACRECVPRDFERNHASNVLRVVSGLAACPRTVDEDGGGWKCIDSRRPAATTVVQSHRSLLKSSRGREIEVYTMTVSRIALVTGRQNTTSFTTSTSVTGRI